MVTQEQTSDPKWNRNAISTDVDDQMVMEEGLIPKEQTSDPKLNWNAISTDVDDQMVMEGLIPKEQSSDPKLNRNAISTDVDDQMVMEEELIPKIRKPYTISKQRERWSKEEHDKFVEALKLHGRAWRKIEDHVGTKTAVQIRSHAQKFFSKVVRKTNNSDAIEIPPPRPKRKPSHPYPRKLVHAAKKDQTLDELERSVSPTSVLFPATLASSDSTEASGSPSPVSSSVDTAPQDDARVSPSATNDLVSRKLDLSPSIDSYDKPEVVSTKILKLFGKDVVVPSDPSDSVMALIKSPSLDMGEELIQATLENSRPVDTDMQREDQPFYYVDESGNQMEKPIPLPWWVFFGGMVVRPFECQNVGSTVPKESEREGSCACSSNESVNADAESQLDKESKHLEESTALEKRSSTGKSNNGVVPCKRYFSQRHATSN